LATLVVVGDRYIFFGLNPRDFLFSLGIHFFYGGFSIKVAKVAILAILGLATLICLQNRNFFVKVAKVAKFCRLATLASVTVGRTVR
jgi:hypothetical protein